MIPSKDNLRIPYFILTFHHLPWVDLSSSLGCTCHFSLTIIVCIFDNYLKKNKKRSSEFTYVMDIWVFICSGWIKIYISRFVGHSFFYLFISNYYSIIMKTVWFLFVRWVIWKFSLLVCSFVVDNSICTFIIITVFLIYHNFISFLNYYSIE